MTQAYEGWAILELMGHRRLGGKVSEVTQYGAAMLRIDVYGKEAEPLATQFYPATAIYCLTPTEEETARRVGELSRPAPVQPWELPRLPSHQDADEIGDRGSDDESESYEGIY